MGVVTWGGQRSSGEGEGIIVADGVVAGEVISGIDVHVEGDDAIDTVVAGEGGDKGVGSGESMPCEGGKLVGAEGGVDCVVDIGPHMEVVGDKAVATPMVGEDELDGSVGVEGRPLYCHVAA